MDSNVLLTQQIQSLEKEVTQLRDLHKGVAGERDAMEIELQQLHDTIQMLEGNLQEQKLINQHLVAHTSGGTIPASILESVNNAMNAQHPNRARKASSSINTYSSGKPTLSSSSAMGSAQEDHISVGGDADDDVVRKAQSVLLAARNKRLGQVVELQKSSLRGVYAATKAFSSHMRSDLVLLREDFARTSKALYDAMKKDLKKNIAPSIEVIIEKEKQKLIAALQHSSSRSTLLTASTVGHSTNMTSGVTSHSGVSTNQHQNNNNNNNNRNANNNSLLNAPQNTANNNNHGNNGTDDVSLNPSQMQFLGGIQVTTSQSDYFPSSGGTSGMMSKNVSTYMQPSSSSTTSPPPVIPFNNNNNNNNPDENKKPGLGVGKRQGRRNNNNTINNNEESNQNHNNTKLLDTTEKIPSRNPTSTSVIHFTEEDTTNNHSNDPDDSNALIEQLSGTHSAVDGGAAKSEISDPVSQKSETATTEGAGSCKSGSSSQQRRAIQQGLKEYGQRPKHGAFLTPDHSSTNYPAGLLVNASNNTTEQLLQLQQQHQEILSKIAQIQRQNSNRSGSGNGNSEGEFGASDQMNNNALNYSTGTALPHANSGKLIPPVLVVMNSHHNNHAHDDHRHGHHGSVLNSFHQNQHDQRPRGRGTGGILNDDDDDLMNTSGGHTARSIRDSSNGDEDDDDHRVAQRRLDSLASNQMFSMTSNNNHNHNNNNNKSGENSLLGKPPASNQLDVSGDSQLLDDDEEEDDYDFIYNPSRYALKHGKKIVERNGEDGGDEHSSGSGGGMDPEIRKRRGREPSIVQHVDADEEDFDDDDETSDRRSATHIRSNKKISRRRNQQSSINSDHSNILNKSDSTDGHHNNSNKKRLRRRGYENVKYCSDDDEEAQNKKISDPKKKRVFMTQAEFDSIRTRTVAITATEQQFILFERAVRRLLLSIGRSGEADSSEWDRMYEDVIVQSERLKEDGNDNNTKTDEETQEEQEQNQQQQHRAVIVPPENELIFTMEKRPIQLTSKLQHAIFSCDTAARCFTVTHLHPQLRNLCQDRVDRAFGVLNGEIRLLWDMLQEERTFNGRNKPRNYAQIANDYGFTHTEIPAAVVAAGDSSATTMTAEALRQRQIILETEKEDELIRLGQKIPSLYRALKELSEVKGCSSPADELITRLRILSNKHAIRTFAFIRRLHYVGAAAVPSVLVADSNGVALKSKIMKKYFESNDSNDRPLISSATTDSLAANQSLVEIHDSDAPVLGFCTCCKTPLRCIDCMQSQLFAPKMMTTSHFGPSEQPLDASFSAPSNVLAAGSRFSNSLSAHSALTPEQRQRQIDDIRNTVASVFRRYAVERLRRVLIQRAEERTEHALALAGLVEQAKVLLMMQRRGSLPVLPHKALESTTDLANSILIRKKELPHSSSEQHFTRARLAVMERERQLKREVIAAAHMKSVRQALDVAMKRAASGVAMVRDGNASILGSSIGAAMNGSGSTAIMMAGSMTGTRSVLGPGVVGGGMSGAMTGSVLALNAQALINDEIAEFMMSSTTNNPNLHKNNNQNNNTHNAANATAVIYDVANKPTPAALMKEAQKSWMPHLKMMNPVPPSILNQYAPGANNNNLIQQQQTGNTGRRSQLVNASNRTLNSNNSATSLLTGRR